MYDWIVLFGFYLKWFIKVCMISRIYMSNKTSSP